MRLKDWAKILSENAEVLLLSNVRGLKVLQDNEGFLDLKQLIIDGCNDIIGLSKHNWVSRSHGQPALVPFNKLTELDIRKCGLRYLFSPSIARGLVQLQCLSIQDCNEMGQLIGNEGDGDIEEVTDLVIFPQLRDMELENLPNLVSVYPELQHTLTSGGNPNPVEFLFNQKVAFPALETLNLGGLSKIKEIWGKQLPVASVSKLLNLRIIDCNSLRDVFTSSTATSFVQLQELYIHSCKNMENIVGTEKREEESNHDIVFPQLKTLELHDLCSLGSFCSSRYEENDHDKALRTANQEINQPSLPLLFDDKVAFPALERLILKWLSKIREIWGNQLPVESFSKLLKIDIDHCHSLRDVFTSSTARSLVHLQELNIYSCKNMEQIVAIEKREEESNHLIEFPQLKTMELQALWSLKSFCGSRSEVDNDKAVGEANREIYQLSHPPLFDNKVAFPCLEKLTISRTNLKELWPSSSQRNNSFCKLRYLYIYHCRNLSNVDELKLSESFPTLQNCSIRNIGR